MGVVDNVEPSAPNVEPSAPLKEINAYVFLGLARTIYIRCMYSIFGREITKYMVIYGVYIWFWPTLVFSY